MHWTGVRYDNLSIIMEDLGFFINSCGVDDENYDMVCDCGTFIITVKSIKDYDRLVKAFGHTDLLNKRIKIKLVEEDYGTTEAGELSPEIIIRETVISNEWEDLYSKMHKHRQEVD